MKTVGEVPKSLVAIIEPLVLLIIKDGLGNIVFLHSLEISIQTNGHSSSVFMLSFIFKFK